MGNSSVDSKFLSEIKADIQRTRIWGYVLILSGLLIQAFHLFPLPIRGMKTMIIITTIILLGSGVLFLLGTSTVPHNRQQIIVRLQQIMLDKNPKRRLWAAQRLVGYAKDAKFSKEEILTITRDTKKIILNPPIPDTYKSYVAVDHIILLREFAVSVPMNKHIRKDFVRIIKPLQKIKEFPDDVQEILADAIAYHPSKLPIQAYLDYQKEIISDS